MADKRNISQNKSADARAPQTIGRSGRVVVPARREDRPDADRASYRTAKTSTRAAEGRAYAGTGPAGRATAEKRPVPKAAVAIAAAVALAIVIALIAANGTRPEGGDPADGQPQGNASSMSAESPSASGGTDASSGASTGAASSSASSSSTKLNLDEDQLVYILGKTEAQKLIARAHSNDDARWIASHPEAYAEEGEDVQAKLLKLAAEDEAALPYVREYPEKYPSARPSAREELGLSASSPSEHAPDTSIPHLYQWDRRWGFTEYNYSAFGLAGCGPTSLAMIYQGVTGKTDMTPYDMGQLAIDEGYAIEGAGTDNTLFTNTADELGLECEELDITPEAIEATLKAGKPIVANVGVGTFTDFGHFFVLAGITEDGQIILNDPYSVARSSITWNVGLIASESKALYAYSKAKE